MAWVTYLLLSTAHHYIPKSIPLNLAMPTKLQSSLRASFLSLWLSVICLNRQRQRFPLIISQGSRQSMQCKTNFYQQLSSLDKFESGIPKLKYPKIYQNLLQKGIRLVNPTSRHFMVVSCHHNHLTLIFTV